MTINEFFEKQAKLDTLKFIACGSVDDGKSTLIGRLLHEAGGILDDQLNALKLDSKRHGTQGDNVDFAFVDGLAAERKGITIDVAYRFFQQVSANLLLQIHLGTNNTLETWQQAHQRQILFNSCGCASRHFGANPTSFNYLFNVWNKESRISN